MFTGHRFIPENEIISLTVRLSDVIEKLIEEGFSDFRCGGAQGFDTIAALKVLEKKKAHPEISLHLFLPHKEQAQGWSENAARAYEFILQRADSVNYSYEHYERGCMFARNRAMVDGSDLCVAYCTRSRGGTAYTVDYAAKKGLKIINLKA